MGCGGFWRLLARPNGSWQFQAGSCEVLVGFWWVLVRFWWFSCVWWLLVGPSGILAWFWQGSGSF